MKGMVFGVVGIGGVSAAAMMGGGGPNDFIKTINKSPQAVYAAFSALGPAGEVSLPSTDGWGARVRQRVVKVPNEQVKLEVLVDDEALLTAEVQFAPDGAGTRVSGELDFNETLLNRIVQEQGGPPMPTFAFQDFLIDQVFAQAMDEMVTRVEEGKPLLSLSETRERWGDDGSTRGSRPSAGGSSTSWERRQAVRPQMDARPQLDPNASAREHVANGRNSDY